MTVAKWERAAQTILTAASVALQDRDRHDGPAAIEQTMGALAAVRIIEEDLLALLAKADAVGGVDGTSIAKVAVGEMVTALRTSQGNWRDS